MNIKENIKVLFNNLINTKESVRTTLSVSDVDYSLS